LAFARCLDGVSLGLQAPRHEAGDLRLVFHQQDMHTTDSLAGPAPRAASAANVLQTGRSLPRHPVGVHPDERTFIRSSCRLHTSALESLQENAMNKRRGSASTVCLCLAGLLLAGMGSRPVRAARAPAYHLLKKENVGGEGGWDYLALDPQARRLYVTHSDR